MLTIEKIGENGGWRCRSPPERDAGPIDQRQDGPGPRDRPAGAFFEPGDRHEKIELGPAHFPGLRWASGPLDTSSVEGPINKPNSLLF